MLQGGCVSCCPAAELKSTVECVCLLPKQWPVSCCWEGGAHEDYFSRLTFSLKGAPFCLSPSSQLLQYLSSSEGMPPSVIFSSLAAAVVVFFLPVKRALPKLRRLLSAAPFRRDLSVYMYFLRLVTDFLAQAAALINKAYSPFYVDSINNISWS